MKKANEWYGADSMGTDLDHLIPSPDEKRFNNMMYTAGASTTVPSHWNNSPFLTGSRMTSAFGSNPREKKKRSIMTYQEFLESKNKKNK
jgi:hypothetical protein